MVDVVTYVSKQAKPAERWLAYCVLPNGEQWLVRFAGATEQAAKGKAVALYEVERAKRAAYVAGDEAADVQKPPSKRGAHFKGKVWLLHKKTRKKTRVNMAEVPHMLNKGWQLGGPRSK